MKILVCISNVPDTTSKINFIENNTQFDSNGVQFVMNPNDEFGLTRAMWFKEKQGASVAVVTVGDTSVEPTLRKALAIGADQGYRIDLIPTDGFSVASELAALIKEENFDLIIAGRESIDYNGGMVPGILASLLDYNYVTNCIDIKIDGTNATAIREIDGGKETLSTSLPLVIGGQKGLVEESDLRIPNMRGIMMARQKQLNVKAASSSTSLTQDGSYSKPTPKGAVTMVDSSDLDQLISLLHNQAKVL